MAAAAVAKRLLLVMAALAAAASFSGAADSSTPVEAVAGGGAAVVPGVGAASWCVARSEASDKALQTALDYACVAGADCRPIQPNGLCYLPNTMHAHASYAFNSYFQRRAQAPGTCDFSGTATIAKSDPSYGSCVYPSSPSAAGGPGTPGATGQPSSNANGTTNVPAFGGGVNPGLGPAMPSPDYSRAHPTSSMVTVAMTAALLVLSFTLQPLLAF